MIFDMKLISFGYMLKRILKYNLTQNQYIFKYTLKIVFKYLLELRYFCLGNIKENKIHKLQPQEVSYNDLQCFATCVLR